MSADSPSPLPPSPIGSGQDAAEAARILRAFVAGEIALTVGSPIFAGGRPRYWHIWRCVEIPGLSKTIAGSTRQRTTPPTVTFTHDLIPGWTYEQHELAELAGDLEALAAGKGQPTEDTSARNKRARRREPPGQESLF